MVCVSLVFDRIRKLNKKNSNHHTAKPSPAELEQGTMKKQRKHTAEPGEEKAGKSCHISTKEVQEGLFCDVLHAVGVTESEDKLRSGGGGGTLHLPFVCWKNTKLN